MSNRDPIGPNELFYVFFIILALVILSSVVADLGWHKVWQTTLTFTEPIKLGAEVLTSINQILTMQLN